MMTLFEFSQSIRALNREKKFPETLKFFRENKTIFSPEQIGANKYIVNEMVWALIETNNHDAIFAFVEQYKVVLAPKDFSFLLKKFRDKPSVNWAAVNKFCDLAPAESLGTECPTIEAEIKGINKTVELASDKENWFALKTKALFETHQYQECFELSKLALETFDKFHYSNDVWFARRIALSKKHLGNPTDALNELLQVLRKRKEWFIQSEIAEIYKENGDFEKALKYAMAAINNFGDLEYKVGLLVLIAEILEKTNEKELSFRHLMLSKLLRQQENWAIPFALENALKNSGFAQLQQEQLPLLKKELKNYWIRFTNQQQKPVNQNNQYITGRIDKILHNNERGADGFIRCGNKSVYFKLNPASELVNKLRTGIEVKFKIQPPKEPGKKEMAAHVKPLTNN
jgi:tetratricopeptide (TPR) repeat protein